MNVKPRIYLWVDYKMRIEYFILMYNITRPLLSFKQIFTINVKYIQHTYAFIENKLHSFTDKI